MVAKTQVVHLAVNNVEVTSTNSLPISLVGTNEITVDGAAAYDAPVSGNPVLIAGYGSATAPGNVSANGDVTYPWYALNGAQCIQITSAGELVSGTAADGLLVNLGANNDVTVTSGTITVIGPDAHDSGLTGNPLQIGGYASSSAPTSVGAFDAVRAWFNLNGAQMIELTSAGALIPGDATNGLLVNLGANNDISGTVTANLAAGTNNIGDVDILTVPAPLNVTGTGTESAALRVTIATDSTGLLSVDDNGGSLTVDAAGDVAHDTNDSGNPVKIGYVGSSALQSAVTTADRVNASADLFGRALVGHIPPEIQSWKSSNHTSTEDGYTIWTPASGKRLAVTHFTISTYGTTSGKVRLWFGASADVTYGGGDQVLFTGNFAPSTTSMPGAIVTPAVPVFCTTADFVLKLTTDASISLDLTVYGYEW